MQKSPTFNQVFFKTFTVKHFIKCKSSPNAHIYIIPLEDNVIDIKSSNLLGLAFYRAFSIKIAYILHKKSLHFLEIAELNTVALL